MSRVRLSLTLAGVACAAAAVVFLSPTRARAEPVSAPAAVQVAGEHAPAVNIGWLQRYGYFDPREGRLNLIPTPGRRSLVPAEGGEGC